MEKAPKFEKIDNKEKELSPEAIEKIMEKVQDINQEGTAYSVIGATRQPSHGDALNESVLEYDLSHVLESGLLGNPIPLWGDYSFEEWWKYRTRERERQILFFNIVGRSHERESIRESYWWRRDATGIIFDISQFKEEKPGGGEKREIKSFMIGGTECVV